LQLVIPLIPPSANHYVKPCMYRGKDGQPHRGKKLTKEAVAFQEAVAIFAQGRKMIDAPAYRITVTFHYGYKQRGDLCNREKVLTDSLQYAGVFPNDSRVKHYTLIMGERDRENPRTEVSIEVMNQTEQQRSTKTNGKVSSSRMREGIQRQLRPSIAHAD